MPLLLLLLLARVAGAVPGTSQLGNRMPKPPPTIQELARDLDGNDRPKRLLAARELRRQVRVADRGSRRAGGDSIWSLEARAELAELTRQVLPICVKRLDERGVGRACAEMLWRLEEPEACAPLRAAADAPLGANRRAAARALGRLDEVCAAVPEAP